MQYDGVLNIDIETYSSVNLKTCGVFKYVESDDFQIIIFAYRFEGENVKVVDMYQYEIPERVRAALLNPRILKKAYNAPFERECIGKYLGLELKPYDWQCTMACAGMYGLPFGLAFVGKALKLELEKDSAGTALIKYFCVPCKPTKTNGQRTRNYPEHAPEKWEAFKKYAKRDVQVEVLIGEQIADYKITADERELWELDQLINDRGIQVNEDLYTNAMRFWLRNLAELVEEAKELSGLENPNSAAQLKVWLQKEIPDSGIDTLRKEDIPLLMEMTDDDDVLRVLEIRQEMSKTSVKKYAAMANWACSDGRIRGMLQYYGANRTGRWAGRGVQLHNLPKNEMDELDKARQFVIDNNFKAFKKTFKNIPDTLSQLIRTAFEPRKGCRFLVSDYAAIEARVLAWLAGETWRLDVFTSHGKIYEASAAMMFKLTLEACSKEFNDGRPNPAGVKMRQKGKVGELACIAEGQLVFTHLGFVPIELVTKKHRVYDGENFVSHGGVIHKGVRTVITYDGLTATSDHKLWVEGQTQPVQFGEAATSGARLAQPKYCGLSVRQSRIEQGTNIHECRISSKGETEKLAFYPKQVRTYDIVNCGPNNRFTVSGVLVHNCGYGGGVGALITMGALKGKEALKEEDLPGIIKAWRKASPNIVRLWYAVENAALEAVSEQCTVKFRYGMKFIGKAGKLLIQLPSGRQLSYLNPRIVNGKFDKDALVYDGLDDKKRWAKIDTYGGKLVENIVQAIARDCLAVAMLRVTDAGYKIVLHVHDELVCETKIGRGSIEEINDIMAEPMPWAPTLPLKGETEELYYYKK